MENILLNAHKENNWLSWGIMLAVMLVILLGALVFSIFYNRRRKEPFLTIKKISIMATFLAIFIISVGLNMALKSLHIELTYVIPIVVGFLLGPLEGMFFSFVADTTNSLLTGYIVTYSPLSATLLPLIGFVSGLMGILYYRDKAYSRATLMIAFQTAMCVIVAALLVASFLYQGSSNKKTLKIPLIIFSGIISLILEVIYCYMFFFKKEKTNLQLWTFILITITLARMIGLIVSPLSNAVVFKANYEAWLLVMTFHSSYLIPIEGIVCYSLIKTNNYIMNLS